MKSQNLFPFRPTTPDRPFDIDRAFQQAVAQHRSGQLQNAATQYQQLLAQRPNHAGAMHMLGVVALTSGAISDAQRLIGQAAQLLPQDAGVQVNFAIALADGGRTEEALNRIEQAIALNPQMPAAQLNRVAILVKAGRHHDALQAAEQLLAAGHDNTDLRINQGIALLGLKRPQEAIAIFEQVLEQTPKHLKALNNLATAMIDIDQLDSAIAIADQALALQPQYAEALHTKGCALKRQEHAAQAAPLLRRATELKPLDADMLVSYADCLIDLHQHAQAIAYVERALSIAPMRATAYVIGGKALAAQDRLQDAIANYNKALEIEPNLASAHYQKSLSQAQLKMYREAIHSLEQCDADLSLTLPLRMHMCDWTGFEENIKALRTETIDHKLPPFSLLAMVDDPQMHLELARAHLESLHISRGVQHSFPQRRKGKIRVGYFSANYFNHPVMYLMAELFESHAKDQFEIHAFSLGPQVFDTMRSRIECTVEHFHDVSSHTDEEVTSLARKRGIDIAVDLMGFTRDGRLGIFANRCAPVQVSYLGYPGTTGADYMDYVIADAVVLPPPLQRFFTEKAVYMPHSYQANDSRRAISNRQFTRDELGLPQDSFVFCCFNNNYKILPDTFDRWMRILHAVPNSVLWLFEDNATVAERLIHEAEQRGISGQRLVFAPRMALDEHLARHQAADLFIDTLPYNAHTTTSDALWAGLPVLTLVGQAFAGRVAASLLTAVGLPELITHTPQDYENRAIHLATHPGDLAALRAKLQELLRSSPLFDGQRFTRDLEKAYRIMFERQQANLPCEPIYIEG